MNRPPNWTYDELLLALDLYIRWRGKLPSRQNEEVTGLSNLLRKLGQLSGLSIDNKYRNSSGVESKLWNFAFIDPQCTTGRSNGSKLDLLVWNDYANRPNELSASAMRIRSFIEFGEVPSGLFNSDSYDGEFAEEGRLIICIHQSRERKGEIRNKKIAHTISKNLPLKCACCNFSFESVYGERGRGYIEVHHKKPVSSLVPGEKTRIEDLELLCSNCHRMIHRNKPWLSVDELKNLMNG